MICNQAEVFAGLTTVLFERGELRLVINNVPVRICPTCGEAFADESVTANLLHQAEEVAQLGTRLDEREYALSGNYRVLRK
jgi:YgiT-type zinc finger domain-containing protein